MNPLVALTTTMTGVPPAGRPRVGIHANYLAVLERVGLTPVLLTPAHSAASVQAILRRCAGLVLSGGEDVDPARYGEEAVPELGDVNPARDEMEFAALAIALERDLPVLAICRGCQVLNVFYGGTLYQDLPSQRPESALHEQEEPWHVRPHRAMVEPGSRLDEVIPDGEFFINTFHHQSVKDLGPGLDIAAVAEDGVIEAVEARDRGWVIGVQWHPERHEATAPDGDPDRLLFASFRQAVFERAGRV